METMKPKKSLRVTIALAYVFITAFTITFLTILITDDQADMLAENTHYQARDVLAKVAANLRQYAKGFSTNSMQKEKDDNARVARIAEVIAPVIHSYAIVRENGRIFFRTAGTALPADFQANAKKAITMHAFSGAEYYLTVEAASNIIHFYMPLNDMLTEQAILYSAYDLKSMHSKFDRMYRSIAIMAVVIVFAHFLMGLYVYHIVFSPLSRLLQGTRSMTAGDYSISLPVKRRDEIGMVSESFNSMSQGVGAAVRKLKNAASIYQRDLLMAENVQKSILISHPQKLRHHEAAFCYRPQSSVSGDFYDLYVDANELSGFLIADVSGHGIASGLYTTLVKPIFKSAFAGNRLIALPIIAAQINTAILEAIGDADNYLTAILARCHDIATIEYIDSGHPLPILRKSSGIARVVSDAHTGIPFAIKGSDDQYISSMRLNTMHLAVGDTAIFYTDGLTEAQDTRGKDFGAAVIPFISSLPLHLSAEDTANAIIAELYSHINGVPAKDDITILVIRRTL